MDSGHMICWKQGDDCFPIGRSNQNPILDRCHYEVECSANTITESVHAQDGVDSNECFLLESCVHHEKNDSAHSVEDQKLMHKGKATIKKSTAGLEVCCKWKDGYIS